MLADMAKLTLKENDMWYVLQTLTGKEEELIRMIKKIVPHFMIFGNPKGGKVKK